MVTPRDLALARTAKKHGANYALRIIMEARRAGIPISLGFALIEQESGFRNVFGHDPTFSIPENWKGSKVTRDKYRVYHAARKARGMQGVGPAQLTWYEYQDGADKRGGAWVPKHNISFAFDHLASLIKAKGSVKAGVKAYNGTGKQADLYAESVLRRQKKWHDWLAN